jgi:phosphatidylglycerophosphate synthase
MTTESSTSMPAAAETLDLIARFSRVHAVWMLAATGASLASGNALPAAAAGALSLCTSVLLHRGHWTPSGALGAGNALTLLRLAMIVALAPLCLQPPGPAAALLVLAIFTLDGVDGWLARKRGQASLFGAHLDMECDALLVLLCALVLYQHDRLSAFILVPGLLRYLYVIFLLLVPAAGGEAPRSNIGRYAFSAMVVSLIASLWPLPLHVPFAQFASLAIAASFARSLYYSFKG